LDEASVSLTFSTSYFALWVIVVFQGLIALALLQKLAELRKVALQKPLTADDWLPVGSPAPEIDGFDVRSRDRISNRDLDEEGAALLFLSACPMCRSLSDQLRQPMPRGLPRIIVFCLGGEGSCSSDLDKLAQRVRLVIANSEEIARRYQISSSPTAVIVDRKRIIRGYGHPESIGDLQRLAATIVTNDSIPPHTPSQLATAAVD
jgi:hypothetical protein